MKLMRSAWKVAVVFLLELMNARPSLALVTPTVRQSRTRTQGKSTCCHGRSNDRIIHEDDDDDDITAESNSLDSKRRRQVVRDSILMTTSLLLGGILQPPEMARAAEDSSTTTRVDERVVLQTSTVNSPVKYVGTTTTAATPPSNSICLEQAEGQRIAVFERTAPSVVFIDTFTQQRDAFSTNVMEVPLGTGSGFVWDDKGHIVTNYHVVRNAKSAQVAILTKIFTDGDTPSRSTLRTTSTNPSLTDYKRSVFKARVVGVDPGKDIAVLKVDAPVSDLFPIAVGTSQGLRVGQDSLAIGNPFGLDHTLTSGIISGIGREVRSPTGRPISNVIQSDAAINPGNSGGPLLDSSGRLIGMNTAIYSVSGGSAGIGFAIPVDTVKYIVDTLIRDGRVVRPVLGISYLESKQAKALGITKGVLVLDVPTSSAAYQAGMRGTRRTETGLIEIGDIITKVEDMPINTEADLFQALESYKPGDRVKITVSRLETKGTDLKSKDVVLTVQLKASADILEPSTFFHGEQQ